MNYLLCFTWYVWTCIYRRDKDLLAKYGSADKKPYAVVTGGSDGIGLAMCEHLAANGFNICIMSRNSDKMKEKLTLIKAAFPSCQTM
jgi:hypothetical protein